MTLKVVTGAVGGCFSECVTSFGEPKLTGNEETCLKNCGQRFIKT